MGKYLQLSRCYLDDRDVSDILSNGEFNTRFLLHFARSRGVFISNKDPHANIIKYLSRQGYSWQELLKIADKLNSQDREERQSTRRVEGVKDIEQVEKVLGEVKEDRGSRLNQVCSIKKRGNIYEMEVTYVDIDTTKQKVFQRRQLTSKIEFEKVGERLDVRFHQNDTCKAIANQVMELLLKHTKADLKSTSIELTGVRDPIKRTAFFLSLSHKVKDFRHIDVIDLKVSNRLPDLTPAKNDKSPGTDNEEEDAKEETQEEAEIKSLVKHAALSGQGLLTSDLYKKLRETGYYLSNIIWSAKETKGEERLVEFVSGFGKPVEAVDFYYDVRKIYPRDDDADKDKTQGELLSADRSRLRRLLEIAAYESLAELQKPDEAKDKK